MRHVLGNILTYAIATLLFIGSALFAWARSSQVVVTTEAAVLAGYEPGDEMFHWYELGRSSYRRNCANCHAGDGSGWDQYPAVTNAATLLREPRGSEHLIDLHIYGLTSRRWRAPMPPMGHIRDVELAAVINYIATTFDDAAVDELITPEQVTARRGLGLSPADVERSRPPDYRN
jgi:mono/diheme cytochrome c family protein